MDPQNDMALLAEFAGSGCEQAFAEVVSRHVDLVYSAAFRQTQNASLAEEVTQAVFVLLARKARSLGSKTVLSAWLFRAARFASQDALKGEFRRKRREQQAFELQEANPASGEAWGEVAPKLDEALGNLGEEDRAAILLRYFENKSFREVGTVLGLGEEAARKRVKRAVGKLRERLASERIEIPAAVLAGLLTAHAIQAAPCGLGLNASSTALSKAGASVAVAAVVKGAIQAMLWAKLRKIAPLAASGVMLLALAVWLVSKEETLTENAVVARHLATSGGQASKVNGAPEKVGTACMSCHRGGRGENGPVIRAVVISGRWEVWGKEFSGEIEIARSVRGQIYERKVIAGGETRMRGADGKNGWASGIGGELKKLSGSELGELRAETEFLSLKNEAKELPAERVTFSGEKCFQISNDLGPTRKSYFNVESGLRMGTEWTSKGMAARDSYLDYRKFRDVLLPSRIKRERGGKIELVTITKASIRELPVVAFSPNGIGPPGSSARVPTGQ